MSDFGDTYAIFYEELKYTPELVGGREPVYDYTELVHEIVGGFVSSTPQDALYEPGDDSIDSLLSDSGSEIDFGETDEDDEDDEDVIDFDEDIVQLTQNEGSALNNYSLPYSR